MEPTLTGLAERIDLIVSGTDTFFLLLGAILVLFMHAGFAFLEVGTVRHKNQVNALVKICLLYTSPSPRDVEESRMPSSA